MNRIEQICSFLDKCDSFADVACDHGYFALYMLKKGLCEKAVISDISAKCLKKAEALLKNYIGKGVVTSVCCDGLTGIDENTGQTLIAGIGGEEIIKILDDAYVPRRFVLQPMKNAEAVRKYLLQKNCRIKYDGMFSDGKNYYFLIKGERADVKENYTPSQLKYGRDSFSEGVFYDYLKEELDKKKSYLSRGMTEEHRAGIEREINYIEGVMRGEIE